MLYCILVENFIYLASEVEMKMRALLRCIDCGHSESLDSTLGIKACPSCKSAKITFTPYNAYSKSNGSSRSSDWSIPMWLKVLSGILGAILFISGFILTFFNVDQSGLVVPIFDIVLYINPLGITFFIVGFILLLFPTEGDIIVCCLGG